MEKLNATLATVEEKLGDSGLYDQSRKAELTDCLQSRRRPNPGWKSARWRGWTRRNSWKRCCRLTDLFTPFEEQNPYRVRKSSLNGVQFGKYRKFPTRISIALMTQIIPSDFDIAAEDSAEFVPMRGVANRHLQTMLPRLIRRKVQFTPHWQRLDLPDGDFLDLAWSEDARQARHKPRLVVFHGLEGSLHSPYAWADPGGKARGWLGVVMHFRGCSGEPNRRTASITRVKPKTAPGFCTGCRRIWHRADRRRRLFAGRQYAGLPAGQRRRKRPAGCRGDRLRAVYAGSLQLPYG
jgi:hypothetical protein